MATDPAASGSAASGSAASGSAASGSAVPDHPAGADRSAQLRIGTLQGMAAYSLWGLFPLYFVALRPAGAWEVLGNRIVWTLVICLLVLGVRRDIGFVRRLARHPRALAATTAAALLIATNWTIYLVAVLSGHVTEAALGYFLNPLVTVALGVVVLRESLRPLQWLAVAIGLVACVYLAVDYGKPPWISICLALSFGSYGLMKNRIGVTMTALQSLTAETLVLVVPAGITLAVLGVHGSLTFADHGPVHALLLAGSGLATAIPLLLFAAAARRVPLVTVGLLQFITPVLQLLFGVLVLGEHMPVSRWLGFGIVWVALVVLTIDSIVAVRGNRRGRAVPTPT